MSLKDKPAFPVMTSEQIKNLRLVLAQILGPFALMLSDEMIVNYRNRLQAQINAIPVPTPPFIPKGPAEEAAFAAGKDCSTNGPNSDNSHYKYFTTPELRTAWEAGKAALEKEGK